jgi:D-sedoheptulose 7-phosphate isomerase
MDYRTIINKELSEAAATLQQFISVPDTVSGIQRASSIIAGSLIQGGKVISCGNGGSHCDAMHFAEELSGRYRDDRKALAAICISDPSHITCVGNDYGFEFIFSRYIEGLGRKDDVLVALSTSGNSKNVINAVDAARKIGMKVIALTGNDGGKLGPLADVEIRVPHKGYADRIQEVHIKVIHLLILLVEKQVL